MVHALLGSNRAWTGIKMADQRKPASPEDLRARVDKARRALAPDDGSGDEGRGNAISVAFRLGIELIAGLVVGVGMGWLLDEWLDTTPIFLLIFFVLGAAAGILGVIRTARQINIGEGHGNDNTTP